MEVLILKKLLITYILAGIIIAGLNQGYAPHASAETARLIDTVWHAYENWIKMLFIIAGVVLTIRLIGRQTSGKLRRRNLYGFSIAALIVHIIGPALTANSELYLFTMPLPWNSLPLQAAAAESPFYLSRLAQWGARGLSLAFVFHLVVTSIILLGTVLFGRRWQCSTLCLFNGFISEVFAPAFPIVGREKTLSSRQLQAFSVMRGIFLFLGCFFTLYWIAYLTGAHAGPWMDLMARLEVIKYLLPELFAAMFFWVVFTGRGYCFYCPAGTLIALVGRISGQRIRTNQGVCIDCKKCSQVCPMQIDIAGSAVVGEDVRSIRCVGCGHCIDRCPTATLDYTTRFLGSISLLRKGGRSE